MTTKVQEKTDSREFVAPQTDIYETEKELVLTADMPGVEGSEIDIKVEKGVLTIQGQSQQFDLEGYNSIYSEYRPANYQRSFHLAEEIDTEKIEATFKDGVLQLVLPKREEQKPQKIAIKIQ